MRRREARPYCRVNEKTVFLESRALRDCRSFDPIYWDRDIYKIYMSSDSRHMYMLTLSYLVSFDAFRLSLTSTN